MRPMLSSAVIAAVIAAIIATGCGIAGSSAAPLSPAPTPASSGVPARAIELIARPTDAGGPMTLRIFDRSLALTNARSATAAELSNASDQISSNAIEAAALAGGRQLLLMWGAFTCTEKADMFIEPGVTDIVVAPEVKQTCDAVGTIRGVVLEFKVAVDLAAVRFDLRSGVVGEEPPAESPASPKPSASPKPTPTPTPTPVTFSTNEKFLLAGIRKDGRVDCGPRRTNLPARAIAGLECYPNVAGVERIGFYLFKSTDALLETYLARFAAEGIEPNTGSCFDGEGEGNYIPGEGDPEDVPHRDGCFLNEYGVANYRATVPGGPVYIGILGNTGNGRVLADFAWKGSQDTPGSPTIWSPPNP